MKLDWEIKAENHLQDTFDRYNKAQKYLGHAFVFSNIYEVFVGESIFDSFSKFFKGDKDNNERF